jgi:two-component system chemotaxis response regulator CheB
MKLHPMPAIIISSQGQRENDIFDDRAIGFVEKPEVGESISSFGTRIEELLLNLTFFLKRYKSKKPKPKEDIIKKHSLLNSTVEEKIHPDKILESKPSLLPGAKIIAIGSSTGGIESLLKVFHKLTSNLAPIVITQHIPYGFSASFAQRLNDNSKLNVYEAKDNMILQRGCAYLAPGNKHLAIVKQGKNYVTNLLDTVRVSRHKPSVDILFRSINNCAGGGAMAIMMTGMGDDGSIAMKELYDNNAYTIAQNEESCVVFGMPKMAIKNGAIKDIIHLKDIANHIIDFSDNKIK